MMFYHVKTRYTKTTVRKSNVIDTYVRMNKKHHVNRDLLLRDT